MYIYFKHPLSHYIKTINLFILGRTEISYIETVELHDQQKWHTLYIVTIDIKVNKKICVSVGDIFIHLHREAPHSSTADLFI